MADPRLALAYLRESTAVRENSAEKRTTRGQPLLRSVWPSGAAALSARLLSPTPFESIVSRGRYSFHFLAHRCCDLGCRRVEALGLYGARYLLAGSTRLLALASPTISFSVPCEENQQPTCI